MNKNNNKIWLSHSGLDILYRCPRCFWLKYKKGLYRPEDIVSRLPDRFDRIIKAYFDKFRVKNQLPRIIQGKIQGKLESSFQEKYFYSLNEKYGFWGKLDECLITPENLYVVIDFKTSSSDPRGRPPFPAYQNQLDELSFLLENNGKKTAGRGYLIFFHPEHSEELHNGFPMIIHIESLKTNPQAVRPRISKAIEVLEGKMPGPSPDCPYCQWYENLSKILNGV